MMSMMNFSEIIPRMVGFIAGNTYICTDCLSMNLEVFGFIILLAAGASFVQRTVGFGFGIFIMTALPFLMPSYGEAVTLSGLLSLTSATVVMFRYLKYVTWKRLLLS